MRRLPCVDSGPVRGPSLDPPPTSVTGAFLAGLVAGYGVAIPVGAIAILILGLSARTSFRVGAAAALAVATADGLYAAVAALGGAGRGRASSRRSPGRCGWSPPRSCWGSPGTASGGRGLRTAAAATVGPRRSGHEHSECGPTRRCSRLTLLNPMTVLYFAALVLGRRDTTGSGAAPVGALRGRGVPRVGELATGRSPVVARWSAGR